MSGYGIDGLSLKWIDDFLTDWKRVCVRDSYSNWCNVTSYVPQGSVFCLLFIAEVVQSNLWMFADDTKIYYTISSSEGSILLQGDLHSS